MLKTLEMYSLAQKAIIGLWANEFKAGLTKKSNPSQKKKCKKDKEIARYR
jgi:hypothetical protein